VDNGLVARFRSLVPATVEPQAGEPWM